MNGTITRVVIIENEKFFADTLDLILNQEEDIEVTDIFYCAEDALKDVESIVPDVILLDIDLGIDRISGLEAIAKLKVKAKDTLILILTIYEEYEKVYKALEQGALGYILKTDSAEKIIRAIHDIRNGGSPMSSGIARKVTDSFNIHRQKIQNLTARENEIIHLISTGMSEKEVAAKLYLSYTTVKKHISNIYEKLHVNTRTSALNKYFGH